MLGASAGPRPAAEQALDVPHGEARGDARRARGDSERGARRAERHVYGPQGVEPGSRGARRGVEHGGRGAVVAPCAHIP